MTDELVHWWLPGIAAGCGATIAEQFTAEPADVTCKPCEDHVRMRQIKLTGVMLGGLIVADEIVSGQ